MIVDDWIAEKIGLGPGEALTRDALESWQLKKLRETLGHAVSNSPFYREKYATHGDVPFVSGDTKGTSPCVACAVSINSLDSITRLPFMTPEELSENDSRMVCVPASEVSRIVTLQETSGTTGAPKRVWFTEDDQELMIDYIHHGLPVMTGKDDVFLVLMPCERPGSVGDLVAKGVERIGSRAIRVGTIPKDGSRDDEVFDIIRKEGVNSGLATAPTAARLAAKSASDPVIRNNMRTILLSAQYISEEDKNIIEGSWVCKVYEHYGMTEMGLGGAMACDERTGYHPREADLLFEIIDPCTGEVLPEGEYGEIVFTTLTRKAMPFIRYRTGDFSRWLPGPCGCGSILKRLDKVGDRNERKAY